DKLGWIGAVIVQRNLKACGIGDYVVVGDYIAVWRNNYSTSAANHSTWLSTALKKLKYISGLSAHCSVFYVDHRMNGLLRGLGKIKGCGIYNPGCIISGNVGSSGLR